MRKNRRSLSITEGLYLRAQEFAAKFGLPLAQLAEQSMEALLAGAVPLAPARTGRERARDMSGDAAARCIALRASRARRAAAAVRLQATCAICTGPATTNPNDPQCATLQPLGPNDALVTVCYTCNTVPAGDPRYVISASVRPGMADGASWARNRRVG